MLFNSPKIKINVTHKILSPSIFSGVGNQRSLTHRTDFWTNIHPIAAFPQFQEIFPNNWNDRFHTILLCQHPRPEVRGLSLVLVFPLLLDVLAESLLVDPPIRFSEVAVLPEARAPEPGFQV